MSYISLKFTESCFITYTMYIVHYRHSIKSRLRVKTPVGPGTAAS